MVGVPLVNGGEHLGGLVGRDVAAPDGIADKRVVAVLERDRRVGETGAQNADGLAFTDRLFLEAEVQILCFENVPDALERQRLDGAIRGNLVVWMSHWVQPVPSI